MSTSKKMSRSKENFRDAVEWLQYVIFRILLLTLFLTAACRFVDHDLRITEKVYALIAKVSTYIG